MSLCTWRYKTFGLKKLNGNLNNFDVPQPLFPELSLEFFQIEALPHLEIVLQQRRLYGDDHTSVFDVDTSDFMKKALIEIFFQEILDFKRQQLVLESMDPRKGLYKVGGLELPFFIFLHKLSDIKDNAFLIDFLYHIFRPFPVGIGNENLAEVFAVDEFDQLGNPVIVELIENIIQ